MWPRNPARLPTWLPIASLVGLVVVLAAGAVHAYPGGTPSYQTDAAPYCASCHSSRTESMLEGAPRERAIKELASHKHLAVIRSGQKGYADLSEAQRAELVAHIQALDTASTVVLTAPKSVAAGETFRVRVEVTGGAGPVVGVGLVDASHRWLARPAPSAGWLVDAPPRITGQDGAAQTGWLAKGRSDPAGRNLSYVNVTGITSDASEKKWGRAQVEWTLRAPSRPGLYPLGAAYWYGTEKGTPLGHKSDPIRGKQVRGGFTGGSGRVLFSTLHNIVVK